MNFWIALLIGLGLGLIIFPMGVSIYNLFRNTIERRNIKRMIKKGEFLTPIDIKDYDGKTWSDQISFNKEELKNFNDKIFNKKIEEENNG